MICFDANLCTGCMACQMACLDQRDIDAANQKPLRYVVLKETKNSAKYQSIGCIHCGKCMEACPMDCFTKTDAGVILLNNENCIGCHACESACPLDVMSFSPVSGKAVKCDGCYGRIASGLLPACVHTCPIGALVYKA